mmetsp:Transcript_122419/g.357369  ORF Transcript_122419/g.357369 Transcript_122419/m.357369 type:complete len:523 (-) Transcript_122419:2316-3884(-)
MDGASCLQDSNATSEGVPWRSVPLPRHHLPSVDRIEVEEDLKPGTDLPAFHSERPPLTTSIGPPDDALSSAGKANLWVEGKVWVLVNDHVEELAEAAELLVVVLAHDAPASEEARHVWVHLHLLAGPAVEGHPVVVPAPAGQALPDLLSLRLRDDGHGDPAIVHLQADLHDLVNLATDEPVLALAHVVGAADGHACLDRPGLGGIDELLLVPVARELELLLAGEAYLEGVLPDVVVVRVPHELVRHPRRPRASHLISVLVVQGVRRKLGTHLLPGDALAISAPPEADLVDREAWHLLVPAVDDPSLALALVVGPFNPYPLAGVVDCRIHSVVRVLVETYVECLTPGLTQYHCPQVGSILLQLHLLNVVPARPGATDADPDALGVDEVVRVHQRLPPVPEVAVVGVGGDAVVRELLSQDVGVVLPAERPGRLSGEVVDRPQCHWAGESELVELVEGHLPLAALVRAVPGHGPDLRVRVRAGDAEGGDACQCRVRGDVRGLADHERGPARDVQVRVQGPHVHVR